MKNSKILLISGFLLGFIFLGQAQSKGQILKNLIEKSKNDTFKVYENLLDKSSNYNYDQINEDVSEASIFNLNKAIALEIIEQSNDLISIEINNEITLDLYREVDAFSYLKINTSDRKGFDLNSLKAIFYRGIIKGNENSVVSISIFENEISGFISYDKGNLVIGKLKNSEEIVLYNDKDLKHKPSFDCEMPESVLNEQEIENYQNVFTETLTSNCVRLYFETEFDIFQNLGSTASVTTYVTNLYNQIGTLYANDGISTLLSQVLIWNAVDPYNATTAATLLAEFKTQTNTINGNLGQLLTFRSIGGGLAAGFNGICNSNVDLSLSVSGNMTNTIVNVPTYSWNVMVATHEFGHLFGSRHTHACVWNGNNTAIDSCSGYTENGCALPGIPSGGGTIMSYCHTQSVGINFNLGFGPQPTAVITNNVNTGTCLTSCNPCPTDLAITANVGSPIIDTKQAALKINASNTIASGATGIYHAGEEVLLSIGFTSVTGATFRGYIEGCTNTYVAKTTKNTTSATNNNLEKGEKISEKENFLIVPNPSSGPIRIQHTSETKQLKVYNIIGKLILETNPNSESSTDIDLSKYPPGLYIITDGIRKQKVIKQ